MNFVPKVFFLQATCELIMNCVQDTSVEPASSTLNRKGRSTGKGRFSNRVNRSSSLHDLARARLDSSDQADGGVRWSDEQKLPNIGMPGLGANGRTLSSKSLHMMGMGGPGPASEAGMMGFPGGMWPAQAGAGHPGMQGFGQGFHPMMGGWGPVPGHPMMSGQMGGMR